MSEEAALRLLRPLRVDSRGGRIAGQTSRHRTTPNRGRRQAPFPTSSSSITLLSGWGVEKWIRPGLMSGNATCQGEAGVIFSTLMVFFAESNLPASTTCAPGKFLTASGFSTVQIP